MKADWCDGIIFNAPRSNKWLKWRWANEISWNKSNAVVELEKSKQSLRTVFRKTQTVPPKLPVASRFKSYGWKQSVHTVRVKPFISPMRFMMPVSMRLMQRFEWVIAAMPWLLVSAMYDERELSSMHGIVCNENWFNFNSFCFENHTETTKWGFFLRIWQGVCVFCANWRLHSIH